MARGLRFAGIWAAGFLLFTSCAPQGVTLEEWEVIRAWLTCIECEEGEYEAVLAIGPDAIPMLASTSRGMPADRLENLRRQFSAAYQRNAAGALMTEEEYVAQNLENIESLWQLRSGTALAGLSAQDADAWERIRESLDSAEAWDYRDDVIENSETLLFFSSFSPPFASNGTIDGRLLTWWDSVGLGGEVLNLRQCASAAGVSAANGPGSCESVTGLTMDATSSSPNGGFVFPSLAEGLYDVTPQAASVGTAQSGPESRVFRLVGSGAVQSGDFVLRYADGVIDLTVTAFSSGQENVVLTLRECIQPGGAMDPTDAPVEMLCADSSPSPTSWSAVTASGGTAQFSGIPEGYYALSFSNLPPGATGPFNLMVAINGQGDNEVIAADFN